MVLRKFGIEFRTFVIGKILDTNLSNPFNAFVSYLGTKERLVIFDDMGMGIKVSEFSDPITSSIELFTIIKDNGSV
jgi:hypothetical protein